jgi:hypothetical protein
MSTPEGAKPENGVEQRSVGDHVDAAPYVEQSGFFDTLKPTLRLEGRAQGRHLDWICPVCHGRVQTAQIGSNILVGVEPVTERPSMELKCECGHVHEQKQGCGYAVRIPVPDEPPSSSER